MPEFLELRTPDAAIKELLEKMEGFSAPVEKIKSANASGRVLAADVYSKEDIPAFSRSSVDGYAILSKDSFGASDSLPAFFEVIGEIPMGKPATLTVDTGQACIIHTGGMLPQGADSVVMIENTQVSSKNEIEVYRAVGSGENIIVKGEDVSIGELVLEKNTLIRASEIGSLMAMGVLEVEVYRKPSVGILSTGDEIVPPETRINLGQIRDINSYTLRAIVAYYGGKSTLYPIVKDDKNQLLAALKKAYDENDIVIVTAGSSASVRDMTADAINELGQPGVFVHGINIKPGKPTILGIVDKKPVIGLPGNPVSAFVVAHLILSNLMPLYTGVNEVLADRWVKGRITINVPSVAGREDWVPVRSIGYDEQGIVLFEPIFYKSNLIYSLTRANGLARIAPHITGLNSNADVEVLKI